MTVAEVPEEAPGSVSGGSSVTTTVGAALGAITAAFAGGCCLCGQLHVPSKMLTACRCRQASLTACFTLEGVRVAAGTGAWACTRGLLAAAAFSLSDFRDCGAGEGDLDRENKPSMRLRREGCIVMVRT